MPAAMYRFRNMPMRTSKCASIQCSTQDPRARWRLREVDVGNTCGAMQKQNPLASYQDFKQPQHACASETLATPSVAFAKVDRTPRSCGAYTISKQSAGHLKAPETFQNSQHAWGNAWGNEFAFLLVGFVCQRGQRTRGPKPPNPKRAKVTPRTHRHTRKRKANTEAHNEHKADDCMDRADAACRRFGRDPLDNKACARDAAPVDV